jgi:hypothetical protein
MGSGKKPATLMGTDSPKGVGTEDLSAHGSGLALGRLAPRASTSC